MKRAVLATLTVLLTAGAMPAAPPYTATEPVPSPEPRTLRLPDVEGTGLDGENRTLRSLLAPRATLLLVALEQDHREEIEAWVEAFRAVTPPVPGTDWLEAATIGDVAGIVRWFIRRGMRRAVPDAEEDRVMLLFEPAAIERLMASLEIERGDAPVALLLDGRGRALWRATAPPGPESRSAMANALRRLEDTAPASVTGSPDPSTAAAP